MADRTALKPSVGICEWVLPEHGEEAIRHAGALGYDGIQITEQGGMEAGHPLSDTALQDRLLRAAQTAGVEIPALHLWSLCRTAGMIHPMDSAAGALARDSIRRAVAVCEAMQIPALMLTSGFFCQIKNRKDFLTFSGYLKEACELGAHANVRIVFESALPAEDVLEMIDRTDGYLKICYDIFNPVRFAMERNVTDDIRMIGMEHIDHFHMKDGPEDMIGCTLLGDGAGMFSKVADLLREQQFAGWVVTENYYADPPISTQYAFDEAAGEDLKRMREIA